MTDSNEFDPDAPVLRQASRKHRLFAFITTSAAVFLAAGLSWPLTMRGYRSEALIEFSDKDQATSLVQNQLPNVIQSIMDSESMRTRIGLIDDSNSQRSTLLNVDNVDDVIRRISLGFREGTTNRTPQLRVVFSGSGNLAELDFVESLAQDISAQLAQESETLNASVPRAGSYFHAEAGKLNGTSIGDDQNEAIEQKFRNVGHVKDVEAYSNDGRELSSSARTSQETKLSADTEIVAFNAGSVKSLPAGAIPDTASILLIGLCSLVIGGVIAWNVRPFATVGFESVDDVSQQLGVPVIATVTRKDSIEVEKPVSERLNWADQVVRICGTSIVGIAALGFAFWLLSANVRDSFNEGWFHGFARIIWTLSGALAG